MVKSELCKEFEMKDLGAAKKILGIEIIKDREKRVLKMSQELYVRKLLRKFGRIKRNRSFLRYHNSFD